VKKFNETYNLNDQRVLKELTTRTGAAHIAIQQIEAGIEGTANQKAEASFRFLDLMGFYPSHIQKKGELVPVIGMALISPLPGYYFVKHELVLGQPAVFPVYGPNRNPEEILGNVKDLTEVITAAFPKAVVQMTTGQSKSGQTIYHTTVRPGFIQNNENGFPIVSGSAECSNASVALMQAAVRMVAAYLTSAALAVASKPKTRTLADVAMEKYGNTNWIKTVTDPNAMFDVLFKDQPKAEDNGVYKATPGGWRNSSVRSPEAKMARHVEGLVKHLKDLGIDVQVTKF
jgi:hypothetical protein